MKHYTAILLIIDSSPHIDDKSIEWDIDPNVILMNKKIWNNYLNNDNDILSLFMQLDPKLQEDEYLLDIEHNILKVQGYHSITPGSMILTLKSMKCLKENFTFDYIVRATTSTFWILPKLKNMLSNLPKNNIYKGSLFFGQFVSGSGMIISKDVVDILIKNMSSLIQYSIQNNTNDDVLLSHFMSILSIPLTDMRICNIDNNRLLSDELDKIIIEHDIDEICCYRVKTAKENRLQYDSIILNKIYNYFYNK